jgi:hypothetical protein
MQINVREIRPSRKDNVLAEVAVEISTGIDDIATADDVVDTIAIDDIRVLQNRHGEFWVAMPSFSVPLSSAGVRRYEYRPTVTLSRSLQRELEDAVLTAFEQWKQNGGTYVVR